ncbi:unnamed protein product [Acanthoscelides obtectus]|uniref:PiggyBac transposable element-derived protein domain-containing protein n=1 Tax=Acanthoscelides obtectus TaxID=200917 RepID=A0A9P0LQB6_ACAOB|nr:unnamed protein product [Acanthoscelides obtectus]CAK1646610.1 PiggyBac transposable element-derived protein 4 [Acanthoscelides obtectus]
MFSLVLLGLLKTLIYWTKKFGKRMSAPFSKRLHQMSKRTRPLSQSELLKIAVNFGSSTSDSESIRNITVQPNIDPEAELGEEPCEVSEANVDLAYNLDPEENTDLDLNDRNPQRNLNMPSLSNWGPLAGIETNQVTPERIVRYLLDDLLYQGRTLITDSWYTSLELTEKMLDSNTHLVGTIRKTRKGLPKEVINAKLKKGEIISLENQAGITISNWRDKRNMYILSTEHGNDMQEVSRNRQTKMKPKVVLDYNKGKAAVNLSDQLGAYSNPLKKSVKWYRKVAFELLLTTSMILSMVSSRTKRILAALSQNDESNNVYSEEEIWSMPISILSSDNIFDLETALSLHDLHSILHPHPQQNYITNAEIDEDVHGCGCSVTRYAGLSASEGRLITSLPFNVKTPPRLILNRLSERTVINFLETGVVKRKPGSGKPKTAVSDEKERIKAKKSCIFSRSYDNQSRVFSKQKISMAHVFHNSPAAIDYDIGTQIQSSLHSCTMPLSVFTYTQIKSGFGWLNSAAIQQCR